MVGSVGAISAGQRAARRRQGTKTSLTCTRAPTTAQRSQPSDMVSNASADSKSSVLSMMRQQAQVTGSCVKQQVLDTGGLLKKKQQFLLKKVQKGLQMVSGTVTECHKDYLNPSQEAAPNPEERQGNAIAAANVIETLEQMGFERMHVQKAMTKFRGKVGEIDDVVQELVAMAAELELGMGTPQPISPVAHAKVGAHVDLGAIPACVDGAMIESVATWEVLESARACHSEKQSQPREDFEKTMQAQLACGWVEASALEKNPEANVEASTSTKGASFSKKSVDDDHANPTQGGA